jgi:mannose-1-phosphate guanylyltransferase
MRAMVMAAGLGTRLRPITYEIPKPMAPVANRPIMEHILRLLRRHGFGEVVANLHWFPEVIRERFGDGSGLGLDLTYSFEEKLLGTAGGVREAADYLRAGGDSFLVMAADALTDIDLAALVEAHERSGQIATLAVKRVPNASEYGVVIAGSDGRVQGFQEKPDPAEALSDLASCMIYAMRPEVFDYFPDRPSVDWALDVFPALLEHDVPFGVHEIDAYWNDVGAIPEYLQGNLDAVEGAVSIEMSGELAEEGAGPGKSPIPAAVELTGRVLVGEGARIGSGARIDGPVVIGEGCRIGEGARIKDAVLLSGSEVAVEGMLVGGIAARRGSLGAPAA